MKHEVVKLWQRFAALPEIWPGWQHWQTPVAFFTPSEAVLIGHPAPPSEFKPEHIGGVDIYRAQPAPKQFMANTSIKLNGCETATIIWGERQFDAALALLAHEAFHVYQMQQGFPTADLRHMMHYPAYDPVINALGEVEARLLGAALRTAVPRLVIEALDARAARQNLLREISRERLTEGDAVGEYREANLSLDLVQYEDYNELLEGLAVYVEMRALSPDNEKWNSNLRELERLNRNGWGAERMRFYFSGMAYGLLCDRYAPGWQQQVLNTWNSTASILEQALNHKPDPQRRSFSLVDFDQLLQQHQASAEQRSNQIMRELKEYFQPQGMKVRVHFMANVVNAAWHPRTSQLLPEGGRLHRDLLMYEYDSGATIRVEQGAIERWLCSVIEYQKSDLTITVNGSVITSGSHCGAITITGNDSKLFVPSGQICITDRECTVRELH